MKYLIIILTLLANFSYAQNMTDISLFWKENPEQVTEIASEEGNLYSKLGHHGPAVENEFVAYRFYFDHKVAIDVYNKTKPQLELAEAAWYPTEEQQKEGWGADQYKAGSTVGLGGVRLWDGEKPVYLDPVTKRTARVRKEANISYMEMLSENVPYKGDSIDVLVRVTVFSGQREAKVEAFAFCDKPVEFLTGVNYHDGTKTKEGKDYVATWGLHPEDVAAFQLNIGAAVKYNPDDFAKTEKSKNELRLISKPTHYLSTYITSACEKEENFKDMEDFIAYLEGLEKVN